VIVLTLPLAPAAASAQDSTGATLAGVVRDASGGVLPRMLSPRLVKVGAQIDF